MSYKTKRTLWGFVFYLVFLALAVAISFGLGILVGAGIHYFQH